MMRILAGTDSQHRDTDAIGDGRRNQLQRLDTDDHNGRGDAGTGAQHYNESAHSALPQTAQRRQRPTERKH
jgi:hypothetical protein